MKVLIAGAASVLGIPLIRECIEAGHQVVGLTRSAKKLDLITSAGAGAVVVDVADRAHLTSVVEASEPDVVVSLLMTLPRMGPLRLKDFEPAQRLWKLSTANLLPAAQRAGAHRFIAESMVFAYGYDRFGMQLLTEDDPEKGPPPLGEAGRPMLEGLRQLERIVLASGDASATEGIVLRYGVLHGRSVPHAETMARLAKLWAMPVPTGGAIMSWIELGDAARATLAALAHGSGGQIYNVVDDEPVSFRRYMNDLAAALHRPKPVAIPRWLMSQFAPYGAEAFGRAQVAASNAKAKFELRWQPRYRDHNDVFRDLYR
jgi:nucleoside-diphosphate-sugar epimerase